MKPAPVLQILNVLMGFAMLAWEWPLKFVAGSSLHRSIEARLAALPLFSLAALLIYQGTNAGLYYLVAMIVYFWAYSEGEVCFANSSQPRLDRRRIDHQLTPAFLLDHLCKAMDSSPEGRPRLQSIKRQTVPESSVSCSASHHAPGATTRLRTGTQYTARI